MDDMHIENRQTQNSSTPSKSIAWLVWGTAVVAVVIVAAVCSWKSGDGTIASIDHESPEPLTFVGLSVPPNLDTDLGKDASAAGTVPNSVDAQTPLSPRTIDELRVGFEATQEHSGFVEKPRSPIDFYHNARIAEQLGDNRIAQQNYVEFIQFEVGVVDPHYRFQEILKLQDDPDGARQIYASLPVDKTNVVYRYAWALIQEPVIRRDLLQQLTVAEPQFAPAFYDLSRSYSEVSLGTQSLSDSQREREALSQFLNLHENGYLARYFLDQSQITAMVDDAQIRLAASNARAEMEQVVRFVMNYNNPKWSVTLHFLEPVTEVFLSEGHDSEFESLGVATYINPLTNGPMANQWAMLSVHERSTLAVKYTDANGDEKGPFEYEFDPNAEMVTSARNMLALMPQQSWAAFGTNHNSRLFYFSSLYAVSYGIKEVRYAFDQDEPSLVHLLTDLSEENAKPYVSIPADTEFAVIQVIFNDGTRSPVVRIRR